MPTDGISIGWFHAAYDKANTPEELEAAKRYQHELQDAMTPEEKQEYNDAMISDFRRMMTAMDEDIADLRAEAKQLEEALHDLGHKLLAIAF